MEKDLMYVQSKPQTAIYYEKAMQEIYNKRIWLAKKLYSRFAVLEDDLKDLGFDDYRDYAYTVGNMLKVWAKDKGLKHIPYTVFCGEFAMAKYAKVKGMETVDLATDKHKEELLYTELLVMRMYIRENLTDVKRYRDVVWELRPVLDSRWLDAYDNKGDRPEQEAMEILAEEYCLRSYRGLNDILAKAQKDCKRDMDRLTGKAWKHSYA
jgi:hypothetical protein